MIAVIGSRYVNGQGDSQIVINKDGAEEGEICLVILNHDEGETAYVVVDAIDLERVIKEVRES